MNIFEKSNCEKLAKKKHFDSSLNDKKVSNQKCKHSKKVCNEFWMIHLETIMIFIWKHVLLLKDIFEQFRKVCLQNFKFDPCYYFNSPSWDAMLKMTHVELDLMADQFIVKGMCDGVIYSAQRYSKANNKYMKLSDKNNSLICIIYLHKSGLYGSGMIQYLPSDGFKWLTHMRLIDLVLKKFK